MGSGSIDHDQFSRKHGHGTTSMVWNAYSTYIKKYVTVVELIDSIVNKVITLNTVLLLQ